jgi:hypothetical protein
VRPYRLRGPLRLRLDLAGRAATSVSRFIQVNAMQEMKEGCATRCPGESGRAFDAFLGVVGRVRRPAVSALLAFLPVALAGCEYRGHDIPAGWNLVLAACFVVVVGPIYLFLRELIDALLPKISFRAYVIGGAVLFVVLLAWLRVLALRTPRLP